MPVCYFVIVLLCSVFAGLQQKQLSELLYSRFLCTVCKSYTFIHNSNYFVSIRYLFASLCHISKNVIMYIGIFSLSVLPITPIIVAAKAIVLQPFVFEYRLSSLEEKEHERQKRKDELAQFEKLLGKSCILFRNLEP